MANREPIEWVEIDVDQCTRTYGTSPCAALLGTTGLRKCYNTYKTCQDKDNYNLGSLTYTYCRPQSKLPTKVGVFPVLMSVTERSGMVNIAGTDTSLNSLGKRETLTFTLKDFPYHDRYTDKYAAERVSGAAQVDEGGYDPTTRGTHFGKLRARWPYYAGRAARYCTGYIDGGVLSDVIKRHYIITDMDYDVSNNTASFEVKDILYLADNDKALAPAAATGDLIADIAIDATSLTLTPSGVGANYPGSGRAVIGTEIVSYTRSGDVVTLTARAVAGTTAAKHSAGDAFQTVYTKTLARVDAVIYDLLVNYAGVDAAFIPTAKWSAEITRWAASMLLTVNITKPTGVNTLIGELAVLGLSIWWDSELQEIGLKVNRPPDEDTIYEVNDDRNIKSIEIDDRDDERLTQIGFYSVIINPTTSATDGNNYSRLRQLVDADAQSANEFGDTKVQQIYSRWLGDGNENLIRILGKRLLNRFRWSPARYTFTIAADQNINLTDVIRVNSRVAQDETGNNINKLMQAIMIKRSKPKHEMTITAQIYQFDQRYGFIAENTRASYNSSTDAQRDRGVYFANSGTVKMNNGDAPYQFI